MPQNTQSPPSPNAGFEALVNDFLRQKAPDYVARNPDYAATLIRQATEKGYSPQDMLRGLYQQSGGQADAARMQAAFQHYGLPEGYPTAPLKVHYGGEAAAQSMQAQIPTTMGGTSTQPQQPNPEPFRATVPNPQAYDPSGQPLQGEPARVPLPQAARQNQSMLPELQQHWAQQGLPESAQAILAQGPLEAPMAEMLRTRQAAETANRDLETRWKNAQTPEEREQIATEFRDRMAGPAQTAISGFVKGATSLIPNLARTAAFITSEKDPLKAKVGMERLEDQPSYAFAQAFERNLNRVLPENPDDPYYARTIGRGAGSVAQMAALGGSGGLGGALSGQLAGGLDMAVPAYEEAWRETGDPNKAWAAFFVNYGLGGVDYLPWERAISSLGKGAETSFMQASQKMLAPRVLAGAARQGGTEAATEVMQDFLSNFTAQQLYDASRDVTKGLGESMVGGLVLGAFGGAFGSIKRDPRATAHDRELAQRGEDMVHDALHESGTAPGEAARPRLEREVSARIQRETGQPATAEQVQQEIDAMIPSEGIQVPLGSTQQATFPEGTQPIGEDQAPSPETQAATEELLAQQPSEQAPPPQTEQAPAEAPSPLMPEMEGGMPVPRPQAPPMTFEQKAEAQKSYNAAVGKLIAKTLEQHPTLEEGGAKKLVMDHLKELEATYPSGAYKQEDVDAAMQGIDRMREELGMRQRKEAAPNVGEAPIETQSITNPLVMEENQNTSVSAQPEVAPIVPLVPSATHEASPEVVDRVAHMQEAGQAGGFTADTQADTITHAPLATFRQAHESLDRIEAMDEQARVPMARAFAEAAKAMPEITTEPMLAQAEKLKGRVDAMALPEREKASLSKQIGAMLRTGSRNIEQAEAAEIAESKRREAAAREERARMSEAEAQKAESSTRKELREYKQKQAERKAAEEGGERKKAKGFLSERYSPIREPASPEYLGAVTAQLQRAFPGLRIEADAGKMAAAISEAGGDGALPMGAVVRGVVYLNPDKVAADTPIHEVAHVYIKLLKTENPALYRKLMDAAGKDRLHARTEAMYPELGREDQLEETAAEAIGKMGARLYAKGDFEPTAGDSLLVRVAKQVAKWLAAKLGIRGPFADYALEDLATAQAARLLAGKEISAMTSEEFGRIYQGVREQRQTAAEINRDWKKQHPEQVAAVSAAMGAEFGAILREEAVRQMERSPSMGKHALYLKAFAKLDAIDASNRMERAVAELRDRHPDIPADVVSRNLVQVQRAAVESIVSEYVGTAAKLVALRQKAKADALADLKADYLAAQAELDALAVDQKAGLAPRATDVPAEKKATFEAYKKTRAQVERQHDERIEADRKELADARGSFRDLMKLVGEAGPWAVEAQLKSSYQAAIATELKARAKGTRAQFTVAETNALAAMLTGAETKESYAKAMAYVDKVLENDAARKLFREIEGTRAKLKAKAVAMGKKGQPLDEAWRLLAVNPKAVGPNALPDGVTMAGFVGDWMHTADRILSGKYLESADGPLLSNLLAWGTSQKQADIEAKWLRTAEKALKDDRLRAIIEQEWLAQTGDPLPALLMKDADGNDVVNTDVADMANDIAEAWEALSIPSDETKAMEKAEREARKVEEMTAEIGLALPRVLADIDEMIAAAKAGRHKEPFWQALRDVATEPEGHDYATLRATFRALYGMANSKMERAAEAARLFAKIGQAETLALAETPTDTGRSFVDAVKQLGRRSRGGGDIQTDPYAPTFVKWSREALGKTREFLFMPGKTRLQYLLRQKAAHSIAHELQMAMGVMGNDVFTTRIVDPLRQAEARYRRDVDFIFKAWSQLQDTHRRDLQYVGSSLRIGLVGALTREQAFQPNPHDSPEAQAKAKEMHDRSVARHRDEVAKALYRSTRYGPDAGTIAPPEAQTAYDALRDRIKAQNSDGDYSTGRVESAKDAEGNTYDYIAEMTEKALNKGELAARKFWQGVYAANEEGARYATEVLHGTQFVAEKDYWPLQSRNANQKVTMADTMEEFFNQTSAKPNRLSTRAGATHAVEGPGKDTVYDWDGLRVAENAIQSMLLDLHLTETVREGLGVLDPRNKTTGLRAAGVSEKDASDLSEWYKQKVIGIRGAPVESIEWLRLAKKVLTKNMFASTLSPSAAIKNATDIVRVVGEFGRDMGARDVVRYLGDGIADANRQWKAGGSFVGTLGKVVAEKTRESTLDIRGREIAQAHESTPYAKFGPGKGARGVERVGHGARGPNEGSMSLRRLESEIQRSVSAHEATRAATVRTYQLANRVQAATGQALVSGIDQWMRTALWYGKMRWYYDKKLGRPLTDADWDNPSADAVAYANNSVERMSVPESVVGQPAYRNKAAALVEQGGRLRAQMRDTGGALTSSAVAEIRNLLLFGFRNQLINQTGAYIRLMREAKLEGSARKFLYAQAYPMSTMGFLYMGSLVRYLFAGEDEEEAALAGLDATSANFMYGVLAQAAAEQVTGSLGGSYNLTSDLLEAASQAAHGDAYDPKTNKIFGQSLAFLFGVWRPDQLDDDGKPKKSAWIKAFEDAGWRLTLGSTEWAARDAWKNITAQEPTDAEVAHYQNMLFMLWLAQGFGPGVPGAGDVKKWLVSEKKAAKKRAEGE